MNNGGGSGTKTMYQIHTEVGNVARAIEKLSGLMVGIGGKVDKSITEPDYAYLCGITSTLVQLSSLLMEATTAVDQSKDIFNIVGDNPFKDLL